MGPLKMKPEYKEIIWGGTKLKERYGKEIPFEKTAESWEIAAHPNGVSTVSEGPLMGKTLPELMAEKGEALLGKRVSGSEKFPLLVKFLDAADRLSLQVHPEDAYAAEHENGELGKTEMWVVLDAAPGAKLIYGVKEGVNRESFGEAMAKGTAEELVNFVSVETGDVFYIPAGTLHAIDKGLLIAEIQQNSDTTYRVFDWNRVGADGKPRELHTEKALDVINFTAPKGKEKVEGLTIKEGTNTRTILAAGRYFATEKWVVSDTWQQEVDPGRFEILLITEGEGQVSADGETVSFKAGDSFLIPADAGAYMVEGSCECLRSYVPDVEEEIVKPLLEKGFTEADFAKIGGMGK